MGWRIKRNDFPKVIRQLPHEMDKELGDFADGLSVALSDRVWRDTGVIRRGVDVYERDFLYARIGVGWYLKNGFYSGFNELGTVKQVARPVVVPLAHESEPVFSSYIEKAIKRACRV